MSTWYWRILGLNAALVLSCLISYLRCDDTVQKLPFCNPDSIINARAVNDLVIVSTLDGRLTAFSTHGGAEVWHLETQPLLSSTLHHVELSSGGKWVRLVPSLRGSLYSVSGESIELLPFDAEHLLSSSFKYSDELVIAGSHESSWLGLDARTGSVVYECSTSGCSGEQTTTADKDLLILRRYGNTVRALEPRTGNQKWNFSVAEHQLSTGGKRECLGGDQSIPQPVRVGVALPEGLIMCRYGDEDTWRHELEAPVAGMWRLHGDTLHTIDVLMEAASTLAHDSHPQNHPSLYIGVHNNQLYVQESPQHPSKLDISIPNPVPWKLQYSRPLISDEHRDTALALQEPPANTLSLITLYGNNALNGNHGFFLYLEEKCDESVQVPDIDDIHDRVLPNDSYEHQHIHVHEYSLWFWWKEVLVIAISSALLLNLMIWPRFFAPKLRIVENVPSNQEIIVVERHVERPPSNSGSEYSGRYENDFTPLRCLGRGGFGVVFEARNNIDHCSYAVKRITLPRRQSKRERVLREVRALAKLEHEHIVRYFNAWLEEPPFNWQEQRDAIWMRELPGANVSEEDSISSPTSKSRKMDSIKLNLQKCDECLDALEYDRQVAHVPKRTRSRSCNDSFVIDFDENASRAHLTNDTNSHDVTPSNCLSRNLGSGDDDDSFIVFANSQEASKSETEESRRTSFTKSCGSTSEGLSQARKNTSFDKRLERIKECDSYMKDDSTKHGKRKKKGHTRHWSLDMCVKSTASSENRATPNSGSKMYLYIQMQLCRADSLHEWLRNNRDVNNRVGLVTTLFSQIVSAVEYVHLAGLIHRDLKPSNIFFAPDGKVKVGDFGLVTTMTDSSQDDEDADKPPGQAGEVNPKRHTHRVGTHLYMSPEQTAGRPYSYKVDIYSLGVILFELLQPFNTESERVATLLELRAGRFPSSFKHSHPAETEVLKMMLSHDPSERPTASGVRARAPLYQCTDERWHFTLPTPLTSQP